MPSLKSNFFYSILLVLANYVFPFLTYPYVSRVLGVTGIGACNFVDSVINYFILFSTLGVSTLGVREIAKHKHNPESLGKTFSNIIIVNLALTGIMLLFLVVATFTVPHLAQHKSLMLVGAFKLVFNCLLVEWLFKGLEDFRFITLRSIIIKLLYVASVFIFVRKREDVIVYYFLSSMAIVVNAVVNVIFAGTKVHFSFKGVEFGKTFKLLLALGVYSILTSMYTTFNVTFLGFVSSDTEVGYYGTATKVYYLVMAIFSGLTGVMLPKMSDLAASGDMPRFKAYYGKAVDLLLAIALPIVTWMMLMSNDIVMVISGPEFSGSVLPMTIIAPLIFVVGYEQILVIQTLMPLGKDKLLLRNSLIGAFIGVGLNVLLVPRLASVGSSIVWIVVECVILLLSQIAVTKDIGIGFPMRRFSNNVLACIPLAGCLFACTLIPAGSLVKIAVSMFVVGAYVLVYQVLIKKGQLLKQFN